MRTPLFSSIYTTSVYIVPDEKQRYLLNTLNWSQVIVL